MPKTTRETPYSFNARMVRQYPNILEVDCSQLYCKLCQCNLNGTKTFTIQQHFRTMKHQAALQYAIDNKVENKLENIFDNSNSMENKLENTIFENKDENRVKNKCDNRFEEKIEDTSSSMPYFLPEIQIPFNNFTLDLCTTFLEANIPLETINNNALKTFLQKYTQNPIPSELNLRSEYVPTLYEKYIRKLQNIADDKQIWVSISECIDKDKNLVVNFIFGLLEESEKGKSYMLNMLRLEKATPSAIAAFFNNSLQILWPEEINYENVRLVVTDAIPYMKAALQSLKILFPNMIYISCLAQTFNKFSEYMRPHFKDVEEFVMHCETVFFKSPYRQHLLSTKLNHLPPTFSSISNKPAVWLKAAIYYCDHMKEISSLLQHLNGEDDIECLKQCMHLLEHTHLKKDLLYIKEHLERFVLSIKKLEITGLPLNESLATINEIKKSLQATQQEWLDKFNEILTANCDLKKLNEIVLENNFNVKPEDNQWTYKYAPVVCTNIEHLSYPKSLLENEKNFSLRHLKKEKHEIL